MKQLTISLLAASAMLPAITAAGPSSKVAVQIGPNGGDAKDWGAASIVSALCNEANDSWSDMLSVSIKTANAKDLIIGGSLETALYTQTKAGSKGGNASKSVAEAALYVRALVDPGDSQEVAYPGMVAFDRREQSLEVSFNGVCSDLNGDNVVNYDECNTDEYVDLALRTAAAHHFNFALDNMSAGDHEIVLQGCIVENESISGCAEGSTCEANANAGARVGSLVVEEVRLVKADDGAIVLDEEPQP